MQSGSEHVILNLTDSSNNEIYLPCDNRGAAKIRIIGTYSYRAKVTISSNIVDSTNSNDCGMSERFQFAAIQHCIIVIQSSAVSSTPALIHVINDDRRRAFGLLASSRHVVDVTSLDCRLFALRNPSRQQIEVYDTKTFKQQGALQVKDLSDDTPSSGLTSCVTNNCVYVSDFYKHTVYKVELSGSNKVHSWRVDSYPNGLSINRACNLLVACYLAYKIQEYTANGSLVREICILSNNVEFRPYHAIQLTSEQLVISGVNVTNGEEDVVEVDTMGRVVVTYTNQLKSTTQNKFSCPRRLSVDGSNECIFVTDCNNDRIVLLNRSLNCCSRELNVMSVEGGLQVPSCLNFDSAQNRLFVGESKSRGQSRVLVFDNAM